MSTQSPVIFLHIHQPYFCTILNNTYTQSSTIHLHIQPPNFHTFNKNIPAQSPNISFNTLPNHTCIHSPTIFHTINNYIQHNHQPYFCIVSNHISKQSLAILLLNHQSHCQHISAQPPTLCPHLQQTYSHTLNEDTFTQSPAILQHNLQPYFYTIPNNISI